MKKEAIVSALLLMSPATQIHAHSVAEARQLVLQQRQDLIELKFVSSKKDKRGRTATVEFFRAENDYTYHGMGGMEYEVVVKYQEENGDEYYDDSFYYAKRMDENTFKLFDCNSTSQCFDGHDNIVFHIFDTPKGKLLKFKQTSEKGIVFPNEVSKEYYQVK